MSKSAFIKIRVEPSLKKELARHYSRGAVSNALYSRLREMIITAKKNERILGTRIQAVGTKKK